MNPLPAPRLWLRFFPSRLLMAALLCSGTLIGGCGVTLEDGYKPRSLDASPDARRSFYASPFTPQAENPSHDQSPGLRAGGR